MKAVRTEEGYQVLYGNTIICKAKTIPQLRGILKQIQFGPAMKGIVEAEDEVKKRKEKLLEAKEDLEEARYFYREVGNVLADVEDENPRIEDDRLP